jgi:hypothetical protein
VVSEQGTKEEPRTHLVLPACSAQHAVSLLRTLAIVLLPLPSPSSTRQSHSKMTDEYAAKRGWTCLRDAVIRLGGGLTVPAVSAVLPKRIEQRGERATFLSSSFPSSSSPPAHLLHWVGSVCCSR